MKNSFILFLLIICSTTVFGQNKISGTIYDNNNDPIFFATIALYNIDSTIASTASTDELGTYQIMDVKDGDYYMEVTMLGFKKGQINSISFPDDNNTISDLNLITDNNLLETVEIKSRRPLLEQHADKLVVNVADNITSMNSNLLDVMKKIPGIIVTGDKIKLAGSSSPTILINGKTTKYMDVESLMKDMPGDNIQKVEIIHQPGAEYDAAGTGPIINVILKKNSLFGTTGSVSLGYSKAKLNQYKAGLNLSHYQGAVNINGGIGYRNSAYTNGLTINRIVKNDTYLQQNDEIDLGKSYRANLSLDWDVSKRHKIGFQSRYKDHMSEEEKTNLTSINFKDDIYEDIDIRTDNNEDGFWKLRSINPYYTFEIDTSGQRLDADFNYITFWNDSESVLLPYNVATGEKFTNQKYNQPGLTNIYVAKLDYTYPFSKSLKLKLGAKYSLADLDNDLQSYYQEKGKWFDNKSESNHFLFDESIAAAYTKLSYKKNKWAGTLGVRYEDSKSNGMSVGGDTTLTRRVNEWFPSASLKRDIVKGLAGIVSYSYRLERPRYSSLNPFKYSLDSYTSFRGNPNLRPEFTHSMKFSLTYENQPFFNIEYKQANDAMVDVIEQDDSTGEGFKSIANLESRKGLNINLGFPLDFIPHISGYGYLAANKTTYDAPYLNEVFDASSWDYTFYTAINFTLPGDINTELSGWYNSGGFEGLLNSEWMYGTSVGMSKRFLEDKLKLSIGVENPFNRFYHGSVNYSNIDIDLIQKWDAPVYNFQVNYKFGNQHFKNKNKRRSGASEELNRAGKG